MKYYVTRQVKPLTCTSCAQRAHINLVLVPAGTPHSMQTNCGTIIKHLMVLQRVLNLVENMCACNLV